VTLATASAATRPPDIAVVRQPIADERRNVLGYELVFGGAEASTDGPDTTPSLLMEVFGDIGLDRLAGDHPVWLTMSGEFLVEMGTPPLRPDRAVLQIHPERVDDELLAVLQHLVRAGYAIAVDDYEPRRDDSHLLTLCSTVKVAIGDRSDADLAAVLSQPLSLGQQLVATGVDSHQTFERCRALGFTAFQGDFFAQPREVRGRGVATAGIGSLRQLAQLTVGDVSFEDLETVVASDVGLSLKLLRYVNSAYFALPRTIGSVREAMTILGVRTVRRWALVIAMSSISDVPSELISLALLRARICETLGGAATDVERESYFTVGLFSVADALLDAPMEDVLEDLPFANDVRRALLFREGPKGELLSAVLAYERGEFPEVPSADGMTLAAAYRDAVAWADETNKAAAA
jgi:c-di-GMP phosphodiesterase